MLLACTFCRCLEMQDRGAGCAQDGSWAPGNQWISSLTAAASLLLDSDKYAEAEELCRGALSQANRTMGPDHPQSLTLTCTLAAALMALGEQGQTTEAEALLAAMSRKNLDPELGRDARAFEQHTSPREHKHARQYWGAPTEVLPSGQQQLSYSAHSQDHRGSRSQGRGRTVEGDSDATFAPVAALSPPGITSHHAHGEMCSDTAQNERIAQAQALPAEFENQERHMNRPAPRPN